VGFTASIEVKLVSEDDFWTFDRCWEGNTMKSWLFAANWTSLGLLSFSVLLVSARSSASPPFELPPQNVTRESYRSIDSIAIDGETTIPVDVMHQKLEQLPEIVEAMHPSISESAFCQRVVNALRRGYLASGFLDCQVSEKQVDRADERILIAVREGHRFYRGEIRVSGGSEPMNAHIKNRLLELTTNEKEPKPLWETSQPMNGSALAKLEIESRVRQALNRAGCDGRAAKIQFVRHAVDATVELHIKLSPKNAFSIPDKPLAHKDGVESERVSDPNAESETARELLMIFRRNFERPMTGVIVSQSETGGVASMGVGTSCTWVKLLRSNRDSTEANGQEICVMLEKDVMLVAATPPEVQNETQFPAWAIPNFNFGITITQQAKSESTGNNASSIKLSWNVNSEGKDTDAQQSGFQFSRLGWDEWFPSESTTMERTVEGRRFTFGANELTVDHAGDLIRLQGTTTNWAILNIHSATNAQVRKACPALVEQDNVREIFVQRTGSAERVSLTEIARHVLAPDKEDHKFYISAANGKKSLWGVLLLMLLNEEGLVGRESLLGSLVEIYALQLSGYDRTIPVRLTEIHREASSGPLTSLALGDLYSRAGDLEKAKLAYESVLLLSGHDRSVQRDLDLIFDNANLAGQLAQATDLKSLLQMGIRIASVDQKALAPPVQAILAMMSDGDDQSTRLENAKQLMRFLYESKLRDPLRKMSVHRISQIEARQQKIAAKAKKKKDDKAKAAQEKRPLR
jgi:hypothetical protein